MKSLNQREQQMNEVKTKKTITFKNFGEEQIGRVITHIGTYVIVFAKNPYGTHNMLLVDEERGEAIRHGNIAVLDFAYNWLGKHAYRKAAFVAAKCGLRVYFENTEQTAITI